MDETARWLLAVMMGLGALTACVGGLKSNIEGTWEDGSRQIILRQYLFVLRGFARDVGGGQSFRGTVFFGRVRLWRYDFGQRHLSAMGFNAEQASQLEGARTGLFRLRMVDDQKMEGAFFGTHFQFRPDGPKDMGLSAPQARTWTRVEAPN